MTTVGNRTSDQVAGLDEELLKEVVVLVGSIKEYDAVFDDLGAYDTITAEGQVYHHVRAGDPGSIIRMPVPAWSMPVPGVDEVSHGKNLLNALNAICLHAALEGGVSMRICWGLNSQLAKRIVACSTTEELHELANSKIIPLSYNLLVRELTIPNVTDKDVVKGVRFIHNHHNERVTLGEIAGYVGLSPEYFSAKFKRETGMTVSAYISRARIQEAEALLRFTNLSIGEIAAQLAYSSQSHFQSAFKRETGMTPQQYRTSIAE